MSPSDRFPFMSHFQGPNTTAASCFITDEMGSAMDKTGEISRNNDSPELSLWAQTQINREFLNLGDLFDVSL